MLAVLASCPARPLHRQCTGSLAAPPAYADCAAGAVGAVAHPARYAGAGSPRPVMRRASATQRRSSLDTSNSAPRHRVPNGRFGTTAAGQRARRGERDWAAACVTGGAARDRTPDARAAAPGPRSKPFAAPERGDAPCPLPQTRQTHPGNHRRAYRRTGRPSGPRFGATPGRPHMGYESENRAFRYDAAMQHFRICQGIECPT